MHLPYFLNINDKTGSLTVNGAIWKWDYKVAGR